jgi:hypothetical protein
MPADLLSRLAAVSLIALLAACGGSPRYCHVEDEPDLAKWEAQVRQKCRAGDVIAGFDRDYRLGRNCDFSKQVVRGSGEWFYCRLSDHKSD